MDHSIEMVASALFALAILHTFLVSRFQSWATSFRDGSVAENLLHLLGEVEVVFGLWAAVFTIFLLFQAGQAGVLEFLSGLNFTEPVFVFVIMTICSSRPILSLAESLIDGIANLLPLPKPVAYLGVALTVGPLLGSLITEPAAMTVTALLLLDRFYHRGRMSQALKYAVLGVLFVNVSIGGTLTHFAAPPVLMVAPKWGWDTTFMIANFGWKGAVACCLSVFLLSVLFYGEIRKLDVKAPKRAAVPLWVSIMHLAFLAGVVANSHHMVLFVPIFLFFIGLFSVTKEFQEDLKFREGFLVGFFLGGLVVLGSQQRWWLEPLLTSLTYVKLYLGTAALTAITDNAALTYLGSQVPGLTESAKYALVAGAVVGGGLTVIANAPNPAGYGILNPAFGKDGISPVYLLMGALPPTIIAGLCFWFL